MYHDIYIMTTTAQLSEEIRHADVGQAEALAAAHFAELRSFRRGWMALRAFQDTVQGWVYDRAFFLRVRLCRRFINKTA